LCCLWAAGSCGAVLLSRPPASRGNLGGGGAGRSLLLQGGRPPIRAHLLRWLPRPQVQRRRTTPHLRPSVAASHLSPSRRPAVRSEHRRVKFGFRCGIMTRTLLTAWEVHVGSVRVAIIGVGNCASALVQGVHYYKNAPDDGFIPGLMQPRLAGYHVG